MPPGPRGRGLRLQCPYRTGDVALGPGEPLRTFAQKSCPPGRPSGLREQRGTLTLPLSLGWGGDTSQTTTEPSLYRGHSWSPYWAREPHAEDLMLTLVLSH